MPRTPQPDDDAALRWDDVDDPSYADPGWSQPHGGEPDDDPDDDAERGDSFDGAAARDGRAAGGEQRRTGFFANRLITAIGALVFAVYTMTWVVGVGTLPLSGPTLVLEVLYQFAEFLAIIASGLWFGTTVLLTRGRPGARAGWFAVGALVLAPWPFIFGVIG